MTLESSVWNWREGRKGEVIKIKSDITTFLRNFRASWLKRIGLMFLVMLSHPVNLLAQMDNLIFEHLTIEDGLSQATVNCIVQDNHGFLWFGTGDGLNRYDGYEFTVYKPETKNPQSLSGNSITALEVDPSGVIWIGTQHGGLNRFNPATETFKRYQHDPQNLNSMSHDYIFSIHSDHSGTIWIGTNNGLNQFDPETETFIHYIHNPDDPDSLSRFHDPNQVRAIYEDQSGVLWIGTSGDGLKQFNRTTKTFRHYPRENNYPTFALQNWIRSISRESPTSLWLGTGKGLMRFDKNTGSLQQYTHDPAGSKLLRLGLIQSIYEDRSGVQWFGTRGTGLNRLQGSTGRFERYQFDSQKPNSISNNDVKSIFEDRSGMLWVGTLSGLNRFALSAKPFQHYQHDENNPNSISSNVVWAFYEDKSGMLWIGTDNGLDRLDRTSGKFVHYKHESNNPHSLSHNDISVICEDRQGVLWVGAWRGGLNRFDRVTETFRHYSRNPADPHSLSNPAVHTVYEDRSGILWVGTGNGLNRFDGITDSFQRYKHDPEDSAILSDNSIYVIYEDTEDELWFGTKNGLNRFDRTAETFQQYNSDPENSSSLSHSDVTAIHEDQTGLLWIGTYGGGFNRFDREKNIFTHYQEKDGLPSNAIYGMLEDDRGNLWLSTGKGLSKFNPKTETFKNYDVRDGLQGNEFSGGAYLKSRTGELFFGGFNGFNVFHPDSIKDNPYIPPVLISGFKRYNTDEKEGIAIEEKGISAKEEIELSYKDNILTFEFAALNYRNTSRNQYAYMLEGFNDKWIQLGTERKATFTNLDPGTYTLRVKGSNDDGLWNEEDTSLKITITPPWWRTWWAYTIYTTFFIVILVLARKWELNRVRLRNELKYKRLEAEKLGEVNRLKSRFFANISHEFRTPLTLILAPVERLFTRISDSDSRKDLEIVEKYALKLKKLINQLLDLAKLDVNKMPISASPHDVNNVVSQIVASFESLATNHKVTLSFVRPKESIIVYFDKEKLETILNNILNNALKFVSEGDKVIVRVVSVADQIEKRGNAKFVKISVSDTGIGISHEQLDKIFDPFYQVDGSSTRELEGTGIGLALAKELTELHHGRIQVSSEIGAGTTFDVFLRLGKDHFADEEVHEETVDMDSDENEIISLERPANVSEKQNEPKQAKSATTAKKFPIALIVEDNSDMRKYICNHLSQDYELIEVENGISGFQIAIKNIPDIVISDVMMPKMDGFEFCKKLKSDIRTSHIPVILLTARASRESKLAGLKYGADDYLTKPFDAKELQVRVTNLIEQRRRLSEHFRNELILDGDEIKIPSWEEIFLKKIMGIIEENMLNPEFNVTSFALLVGMSRMQLHRKIHSLTGMSASGLIRTFRIRRSAQLLKAGNANVSEIAYQVGFNDVSYFNKCFRKHFEQSPTEYNITHPRSST